jgi:chromosome segregation ATPase
LVGRVIQKQSLWALAVTRCTRWLLQKNNRVTLMVRQVQQPHETENGLDKTDELPVLDMAAYESELLSSGVPAVEGNPADSTVEEKKLQPLPMLPAADALRDIEAWIAEQDERAQAYQRTLDETQRARTEAQARAEHLALELEIAQKALHAALCRANDGERAALDNAAATRAAETRVAELATDLDGIRSALASAADRAGGVDAELARTRDALAARVLQHEQLQVRHGEITTSLKERSQRVSGLESELATVRTQLDGLHQQLAQRADQLTTVQAGVTQQQVLTGEIVLERDALRARVAKLQEQVDSRHWRRGFWESMWRSLDAQLAEADAARERVDAERAEFAGRIGQMTDDLAARETAIASLTTQSTTQAAALDELAATRSREMQEVLTIGETMATEFKALEERHRITADTLATRERELAEVRAACLTSEQALSKLAASDSASAARVAELEALAANLGRTLQTQTEAAQRVSDTLMARECELSDGQARIIFLETEIQTLASRLAAEGEKLQTSDAELTRQQTQLAAARKRVAAFELEATQQAERMSGLQSELTQTNSMADEARSQRQAMEADLERTREQLRQEIARAGALESGQRELALELERTRGALDERDLQLRRLERYATSSAQVLSRIRIGIERGDSGRRLEVLAPGSDATLVPINDSDAPAVPLGRHTTIGRAPESDLCLKDTSVSRRHAVLTIGPNGAFIEDLRSVNGVKLNRQRVRHARLADGDVIELGSKLFRFTAPPSRSADAAG